MSFKEDLLMNRSIKGMPFKCRSFIDRSFSGRSFRGRSFGNAFMG